MKNNSNLNEFYREVSQLVKKERKKKKITQLELAQLLGFDSASSISNPEINYNNSHFSLAQLYNISIVLEIDIKELIPSSFNPNQ